MSQRAKVEELVVRYEPDTGFICVIYPPGRLEEAGAIYISETITRYHLELGGGDPAFVLTDNRHLTGISPEARKWFVEARNKEGAHNAKTYLAVFGGSFATRTFGTLLMKALMLVSDKLIATVESDEETARAWLSAQKRVYLDRKAKLASSQMTAGEGRAES